MTNLFEAQKTQAVSPAQGPLQFQAELADIARSHAKAQGLTTLNEALHQEPHLGELRSPQRKAEQRSRWFSSSWVEQKGSSWGTAAEWSTSPWTLDSSWGSFKMHSKSLWGCFQRSTHKRRSILAFTSHPNIRNIRPNVEKKTPIAYRGDELSFSLLSQGSQGPFNSRHQS